LSRNNENKALTKYAKNFFSIEFGNSCLPLMRCLFPVIQEKIRNRKKVSVDPISPPRIASHQVWTLVDILL
jgi:hypothetical protein